MQNDCVLKTTQHASCKKFFLVTQFAKRKKNCRYTKASKFGTSKDPQSILVFTFLEFSARLNFIQ